MKSAPRSFASSVLVEMPEQGLDRLCPNLVWLLIDGREFFGRVEAIHRMAEPDHAQVLGDPDAKPGGLLHEAEGKIIIDRKNRCRRIFSQ